MVRSSSSANDYRVKKSKAKAQAKSKANANAKGRPRGTAGGNSKREAYSLDENTVEGSTPMPPPEIAELEPVALVPRRSKPATTPTQRRAAQNLLDALGGPSAVIPRLRASENKNAHRLADAMVAKDFDDTSFYFQLTTAGLSLVKFTEILLDVNHASAIGRLVMSADHVAEDILAKATDQIVPHPACLASGRILVESNGVLIPTDAACFDCQGSGYVLKSAEKEWVDLYLELIKLKKNASMVTVNKSLSMMQQNNLNVYGDLQHPDGAPSVDSIIRRADEQAIALPSRQVTDGSERLDAFANASGDGVGTGMPEDESDDTAIEAEVVAPTGSVAVETNV